MTRPTVRMTFEHTHRELLPSILLLNELQERGFEWELENVYKLGPAASEREIVVVPFLYDNRDYSNFLRRHQLVGFPLVNLMYEQFTIDDGRSYSAPGPGLPRDEATHCAWGPRSRRFLLEHGVADERICVSGPLRFDIYDHRDVLRSRNDLAAEYGLDPGKRWVLLPFNFGGAYFSPKRIRRLARRGFDITPDFMASSVRARDQFMAMVDDHCPAFPDVEFIVRTHPSGIDAVELAEGRAGRQDNLHVIADLDIAHWIAQAHLVVVWTSSTGVEAMAAGVPAVALEPSSHAERFGYDVTRILPRVDTADEVAAAIDDPAPTVAGADWELFDDWFVARNGAGGRLADLFATIDTDYAHRGVRTLPRRRLSQRAWQAANDAAELAPPALKPALQRLGWRADPPNLPVERALLEDAVASRTPAVIDDAVR